MLHMKRCVIAALAIGCAPLARAEIMSLRMPGTYILPSFAKATYISRMGERHGGSHLGLQEYTLNVPFTDPRRSHINGWWLNVQGNATVTVLDVGGNLDLRKNELFDFSIPVTLICPLSGGDRITCTVMPRIASDGVHPSRAWDLAVVADYAVHRSETFTYSIGLASSPRFADYAVVPYFSFSWQATPEWLVRMRGYRLAALYKASKSLQLGPTIGCEGGSWMVDTPGGQRVLRVRALAVSLLAEYDFSRAGQAKRVLSASVGTTLATSAEICRRNAGHDSEAGYHYKPGVVLSAGVDFRF